MGLLGQHPEAAAHIDISLIFLEEIDDDLRVISEGETDFESAPGEWVSGLHEAASQVERALEGAYVVLPSSVRKIGGTRSDYAQLVSTAWNRQSDENE